MRPEDDEFRDDPEAGRLAERLARTDFSAGAAAARVRARLGARADRGARAARPLAALSLAGALAAFALPFVLKDEVPATLYPRGERGLPVLSGRLPAWGAGPAEDVFETRAVTIDEIFEIRNRTR